MCSPRLCKSARPRIFSGAVMKLEPLILEDRFVRLEPMGQAHKEAFRAVCDADPATFEELYPYAMHGEHFEPGWTRMYVEPAADRISFAVTVGGRCVGATSFLRIDPANSSVEIGATFYHPDVRGGAVNPAAKRL